MFFRVTVLWSLQIVGQGLHQEILMGSKTTTKILSWALTYLIRPSLPVAPVKSYGHNKKSNFSYAMVDHTRFARQRPSCTALSRSLGQTYAGVGRSLLKLFSEAFSLLLFSYGGCSLELVCCDTYRGRNVTVGNFGLTANDWQSRAYRQTMRARPV